MHILIDNKSKWGARVTYSICSVDDGSKSKKVNRYLPSAAVDDCLRMLQCIAEEGVHEVNQIGGILMIYINSLCKNTS